MLVLSQTIDALACLRAEMHVDLRQVTVERTIPASRRLIEDRLRLLQQHSAGGCLEEMEGAICPDFRPQFSIGQNTFFILDDDRCIRVGERFDQRPGDVGEIPQIGRAHAHAIRPPRLKFQYLPLQAPVESIIVSRNTNLHLETFLV